MRRAKNAAAAGGRMKVQPEHIGGVSDQELRAAQYGMARKPQLDAEIETVEIDDGLGGGSDDTRVAEAYDNRPVKATVANGRTVEAPVPGKRRPTGWTNEGVQCYGPVMRRYGPGEEVTLEAWEVHLLQERGFLVDPSKVEAAIQDGKGAHATQEGAHQFFRSSSQ